MMGVTRIGDLFGSADLRIVLLGIGEGGNELADQSEARKTETTSNMGFSIPCRERLPVS